MTPDPSVSAPRVRALQGALLAWYRANARDLPWRRTRDPYAVWLSEVMLQQTRVETVIPYYERFLAAYPDVTALADADLDDVLARWSGLGYYRRARMLHRTAREVRDRHGGRFPDTAEGLRELHGVGPYTAGAVASIAFARAAPLVDGNVARVLARLFAVEDDVRAGAGLARVWRIAAALVPARDAGAFNQALMELGATICSPRAPRCLLCPVREDCDARALGRERALPLLAPRRRPALERRVAVVAEGGGRVLLGRRAETGTFAGMWEPPSRLLAVDGDDDEDAAARVLLRALGLGRARVELAPAGRVVHVLSHRRLEVGVVTAALARTPARLAPPEGYAEVRWVAGADLGTLALATYARKVLARANFC